MCFKGVGGVSLTRCRKPEKSRLLSHEMKLRICLFVIRGNLTLERNLVLAHIWGRWFLVGDGCIDSFTASTKEPHGTGGYLV